MTNKDYRAIEIISNNCTCMLSKHAGERMLLTDYSKLIQMTGTDVSCRCTFKHYDDRRSQHDRRKFDINSVILNTYRRTQPFGRRVKDQLTKMRYERMLEDMNLVA
jgi:hypothetical protein